MKCKCRFIMTLVLCLAGVVGLRAQSGADRMNEIKLSGKYYTAEATDHDQDKAFVSAFGMLLGSINMALMEEEQPTITSLQLESHVKSIDIQRGADVMVFVYVEKSRLALMQTNGGGNATQPSAPKVQNHSESQPTKVQTEVRPAAPGVTPEVISRLVGVETFMSARWILDNARNMGEVSDYGSPRTMGNVEGCYILAVNEDKDVVGVLSPKTDGKRTDLRTGAVADMSRFKGCAAVCVRLNSK